MDDLNYFTTNLAYKIQRSRILWWVYIEFYNFCIETRHLQNVEKFQSYVSYGISLPKSIAELPSSFFVCILSTKQSIFSRSKLYLPLNAFFPQMLTLQSVYVNDISVQMLTARRNSWKKAFCVILHTFCEKCKNCAFLQILVPSWCERNIRFQPFYIYASFIRVSGIETPERCEYGLHCDSNFLIIRNISSMEDCNCTANCSLRCPIYKHRCFDFSYCLGLWHISTRQ